MEIRKPAYVAFVTGYGHFIPYFPGGGILGSKPTPDRAGYTDYLSRCADVIVQQYTEKFADQCALVYVTGGVVDVYGQPEAESGTQHIRTLLLDRGVTQNVYVAPLTMNSAAVAIDFMDTNEIAYQPIVCSEQIAIEVLLHYLTLNSRDLEQEGTTHVQWFVDEVRQPYAQRLLELLLEELLGFNSKEDDMKEMLLRVTGILRDDTHPNSTPEAQARALALLNEQGAMATMFAKIAQATGRS